MYKESAAPRLQARLTFGSSSLAPPPELPRLAQTGPAPSLPAPQYNHYPICSTNRASKAQLGPRSATVNLAHNTLSSELDASAYVALPTLRSLFSFLYTLTLSLIPEQVLGFRL
ncbi:uncharacterized protein PGTG_13879 [Puccinia graminis f. sp. tritici CRL 75-36-700-3]|uniref:Uncharacterized protein n=1 Tax=Puccinia graminis f. sp. tritici (strain CRL 75-36-700-3 / race SCCL) TaxID=418459 RepID=E3KT83_PUCGT|nr:uncharacterized protein PGTG_13879 [Puccinia graminis f. sp. tritici CRL 75-36-700-3]EFP87508.1 hypothetical protein PGTG_13879 [Puccinia graminis f. sp. tritici CRL 75-36-700-3]